MGDPKGFLKVARAKSKERPVEERVAHFAEFVLPPASEHVEAQASRCMDCGIPFCHQGCPLGNLIPEWNDLVYRGRMDEAARRLEETNNFPEVTSRVCPAPCEASCVLNLEDTPVAIKDVERAIADHAMSRLTPRIAQRKSGRRVAIIGSGPAGLACAQELARAGHEAHVLERDDRVGGLLRYGIPDFKMEKGIIDLRVEQMRAEGVVFHTGVDVGARVTGDSLRSDYDAVVLAIGARVPRDLPVEGRALPGVHFAMDFLAQQNARVAGDRVPDDRTVLATGSDCVGTSIRQGATSVTQLELMPKPPLVRVKENPWPEWPLVLRTSSSHEEGARELLSRDFAVMTKRLVAGPDGRVAALEAARVELRGGKLVEVDAARVSIPCELVLLAMGFVSPERAGIVEQLGVALDPRGNVLSRADGRTNVDGVFAAGDASRGQSLVVWAIADGRRVARGVGEWLARSNAPRAALG